MSVPAYFIPDRDPPTFYPLHSFLRLPSVTAAAEYIAALTAPGDLVLDPFACSPHIARVAAQMGRRVLAVESNPLWSWLARTMATPPTAAEINAALARLGDALKDDIPLRTHINRMYATLCATCHQLTPVDYFVHTREGGPIQRHYTCTHCGETRDDDATEDDLKRAAAFDAHGLHYHMAFSRVAPEDGLHAERIRRILDVYTPRNLDALVTLTIKIDALFRQPRERDVLLLLLLHLLDRGTSFYARPAPDAPAQLTVHKQFVEFNLWREMEAAARALAENAPEQVENLVESATAVLDPSAAPHAFVSRGSAKAIARTLAEQSVALVLSAPPTRRLAVWALSYFWGAWILGRAAVESLIPALDPHKDDPQWERRWYFDSLAGSMDALTKLLRHDAHAVFLFNESWLEVIETLLLAAAGARLELETFLFQPKLGQASRGEFDSLAGDYRILFAHHKAVPLKIMAEAQLAEKIRTAALAAGREVLTRRGEPLAYAWVHHAAYTRAFAEGYLAQALSLNTKIPPSRFVFIAVREGLSEGYAHDLDHYQTPDQFVWLRHPPSQTAETVAQHVEPPLIDRVDDAVRQILTSHRTVGHDELQNLLYRQFHGDLTPEAGLVELCAQAYAEEEDGVWYCRTVDGKTEKSQVIEMLARLGERLEFRIVRPTPPGHPPGEGLAHPEQSAATFDLIWEWDGEIAHGFIWRDVPRFDDLAQLQIAPARGYLVAPESQVALLRERVRRLPLSAEAFREAGWDFVRAPFVDQLLQQEKIERHDILLITGLVPPVAGERTQLELF